VGSGVVVNQKAVVTVWGNSSLTKQESDAANEGENLILTLWVKEGEKENPLEVTSVLDGLTGTVLKEKRVEFRTDAVLVIETEEGGKISTEYVLEQNYPNPFNPTTVIRYGIPKDGRVTLGVYNLLGQKVMSLVDEVQKAGHYEVVFDALSLSSGVYFYRMNAMESIITKKLVLLR
jgi:hypothetical protein